jgi:hypothetical protein
MRFAIKKTKSPWEQAVDPIVSKMRGRTLTVNGKPITAEAAMKPAVRALGGLVIATVVSAVVSSVRGEEDS